jgi:hypothetical protein
MYGKIRDGNNLKTLLHSALYVGNKPDVI